MVLEKLPLHSTRNPLSLLTWGMLIGFISLSVSCWVFENHASLVMVFFVVVASWGMVSTYTRHTGSFPEIAVNAGLLLVYFLGICAAFTVVNLVLGEDRASALFEVQDATIDKINGITGKAIGDYWFLKIMRNNLRVASMIVLMGFAFGEGASVIPIWNLSVIAAWIGDKVRDGLASGAGYFSSLAGPLGKIALHGTLEIAVYVLALMAGIAFSNLALSWIEGKKLSLSEFLYPAWQCSVAIVLLALAAFAEVASW